MTALSLNTNLSDVVQKNIKPCTVVMDVNCNHRWKKIKKNFDHFFWTPHVVFFSGCQWGRRGTLHHLSWFPVPSAGHALPAVVLHPAVPQIRSGRPSGLSACSSSSSKESCPNAADIWFKAPRSIMQQEGHRDRLCDVTEAFVMSKKPLLFHTLFFSEFHKFSNLSSLSLEAWTWWRSCLSCSSSVSRLLAEWVDELYCDSLPCWCSC